jgi:uncharacterized protein
VKVPLTALGDRPVHLDAVEDAKELALNAGDAEFVTPVETSVKLTRMQEDVLAQGASSTRVRQQCSRCLEPVETDVSGDFESLYVPTTGAYGKRRGRSDFEWGDQRVSFYTNDIIDLDDDIRQCLLLELPRKPLCRPDCAGLCPDCGRDLNDGPCDCDATPGDDTWAALRDLIPPDRPSS